jgi:hypothetical protein
VVLVAVVMDFLAMQVEQELLVKVKAAVLVLLA